MKPPISRLNKQQQSDLLRDLNYLNLNELKSFCKTHSIPFSIWIETPNGPKKTSEDDRKGIILERVVHFLRTGEVLSATMFPAHVVSLGFSPANSGPTDRLQYGQYHKDNAALFRTLERLTNGEFKDGAIARMLAREYWSRGVAPTLQEYAIAWQEARKNRVHPQPEWAFLSDRADHKNTADWKAMREEKAKRVMRLLRELC